MDDRRKRVSPVHFSSNYRGIRNGVNKREDNVEEFRDYRVTRGHGISEIKLANLDNIRRALSN